MSTEKTEEHESILGAVIESKETNDSLFIVGIVAIVGIMGIMGIVVMIYYKLLV